MAAIEPVRWAHDRLELLDQTLLPLREVVRHYARWEDVAQAILFVAALPPRVSIPELIIKPTWQAYG